MYAEMYALFFFLQKVWGPIFEGRNKILILGKVLKCMVIPQKYTSKLLRI